MPERSLAAEQTRRRFLRIMSGAAASLCLGADRAQAIASQPGQVLPGHVLLGHAAPDFTRLDINHQQIHLAGFRGKVVLLNFWASWCGPCLEEMPRFTRWSAEYAARGLEILGVSMDDDVADARAVVARLGVHYPILMGDPRLAESYGGVLGLPVSFLIDRGGILRARIDGQTNLDALEQRLRSLMGERFTPAEKT